MSVYSSNARVAVLRVGLCLASTLVLIGVAEPTASPRLQDATRPATLFEMPVPGGLRAAVAALNDRVPADRSQFLLEVIRRSYTTFGAKTNEPDDMLRTLAVHFDRAGAADIPASGLVRATPAKNAADGSNTPDTLPLPLAPEIWTSAIFATRTRSPNLVSEILKSRNAARMYYALMSLDDPTRAWLATQPALITDVTTKYSAAFLLAAPGLRIAEGIVRVPGGDVAAPTWEALVGRRVNDPVDFVRGLVMENEGRLAYFFGAISQLTPAQIQYALHVDTDSSRRVEMVRRLYAVFDHVSIGWQVDERPFWRPALDPALLIADLKVDDRGRPMLPGTQRLWTAVFADADPPPATSNRETDFSSGDPVDFVWLCEQVFKGSHVIRRRPYQQVLFASRVVTDTNAAVARDVVDALRAVAIYPALVAMLERAGTSDVRTFANAARRASRIATIGDEGRLVRALAQFQGALSFVTRASSRRPPNERTLDTVVSSLAAVELSERGEYDGRLVRWLSDAVDSQLGGARLNADAAAARAPTPAAPDDENANPPFSAGSIESKMVALLAGPSPTAPQFVDWEGTRYRVDFARAEDARLAHLLGDRPHSYASSAETLTNVADALADARISSDRIREQLGELERVSRAADWDSDVAAQLQRVRREAARGSAGRFTSVVTALRSLGDDLLARGLTQLAYAVAMGQRDRAVILAADAASRHDFGLKTPGADRSTPWQMPGGGAERMHDWHMTGSLLGVDVRLAEFSLLRLSAKPPVHRPSLNDMDRRLLTEAAVLAEPPRLTDDDRDKIAGAIAKGRSRINTVRTEAEATSIADAIRLSPVRRTELAWIVAHDPGRLAKFLSPTELLWLGVGDAGQRASLNAWGAPAEGRTGCVCLTLLDRRPLDTLGGRWESGILASGFADLNLRLAELLAELKMPASLLGPVLASATLDFTTNAVSRDPDDRRGLVEFVQALRVDHLEQYLALLTTEGPLVPVSDSLPPRRELRASSPELRLLEATTGGSQ